MSDENEPIILSRAELKEIGREGGREGSREILLSIGIDIDEPFEAQRDNQFVRDWRLSSEKIKSKAMTYSVTLFIAGILGLIVTGLKYTFIK